MFITLTDHPGGAERVASTLANALASRGWDVEWRVLSGKVTTSFSTAELRGDINVKYGPAKRPAIGYLLLPFVLMGARFDLLFTTHIYTSAMLSILRWMHLVRAARFVSRESTTVFDSRKGYRAALMRWLYAAYGAQDMIVCQTGYMADHVEPHLRPRLRHRIIVLANPVDMASIERRSREPLAGQIALRLANKTNILVCGSLITLKQPVLAFEVFAAVRLRTQCALQLIFVGDGEQRHAVEGAARAAGLAKEVVLLGQQANPFAIMVACQYGLMTSSREGFPNVLLEMMACGMRAIVTTPCAGDLDTLTDVHVTTDFSKEALVEALSMAIIDNHDFSATYRAEVAGRSVERYVDAILGEQEP